MKHPSILRKVLWPGIVLIGLSGSTITLSGCVTPAEHTEQLHSHSERQMTVGVVQKEIRTGMSQAEVAEALGSPNIVTRDKQEIETWIYDKIATEVSYSASEMGGGLLIIFGGRAAGATAQAQRTLTVIIKFKDGLVHEFSYHTSRF